MTLGKMLRKHVRQSSRAIRAFVYEGGRAVEVYQGKGVSPGIAFGSVYLLQRREGMVNTLLSTDAQAEWAKFEAAKATADQQLEALYRKTCREIGEEEAMIVDVQRMMLEDGDLGDRIRGMILEEKYNAPYAVTQAGQEFSAFFAALDDPYMRARATDVSDVTQRLVGILLGLRTSVQLDRPSVVVAEDLTPSETLQLDKSKIRAFVTRRGSGNSHTAILARVMNIPAIVQADIPMDPCLDNCDIIVDGTEGRCYVEPDAETVHRMQLRQRKERERRERLESVRGLPTITKDGKVVHLYANIGDPTDLDTVLENDAEGIGLFRSEFLYLGRTAYPTEDEQFAAYRKVVEGMGGRQVVIRTLDIGADKKVDYFELAEEENPALGYRGIRICLDRTELFKTQLRALYRASALGKVGIMFPMITSLWEVRRCRELAAEVRSELAEDGIPIGQVELGVMIETPAAVMIAPELAKEVDFFSVGTNDLTQYTLALDRQNDKLEAYYDPRHPALLRMLRMVAESARDQGIWAGVCGELAADPRLTETFVEMGFEELSVSPGYILEMRSRIRELDTTLLPRETAEAPVNTDV